MNIGVLISNLMSLPPRPDTVPKGYSGAPEMIGWQLTEEFVKRGHHVTLFASGDSKTTARLVSVQKRSSANDARVGVQRHVDYEYWLIARALEETRTRKFDIVHSHLARRSAPFASFFPCPIVATLHSPIDAHDSVLENYARAQRYVSISDAQRRSSPGLSFVKTIYHGIDIQQWKFIAQPNERLVFVGRIVPNKGLHIALKVAHAVDAPLEIFGDVPEAQAKYFTDQIRPHISNRDHLRGFIAQEKLRAELGKAKALLFPIDWEEPFGLVMIEAMACGTPVVAFRRGSVPEVIKDGETGFIVEPGDVGGMVRAVKRIYEMPEKEYQAMRRACRKHVEENFTVEKMVDGYEAVYKKVIAEYNVKS